MTLLIAIGVGILILTLRIRLPLTLRRLNPLPTVLVTLGRTVDFLLLASAITLYPLITVFVLSNRLSPIAAFFTLILK